jgi:3-isopropylmalate dehydratase, large subunit
MGKTTFDKIWDSHVVKRIVDGPEVIYIDRHLVHEVTSPQAFTDLRKRGLKVRRPDRTFAVCDHNTPTHDQDKPIADPVSAEAVKVLYDNTQESGIKYFPLGDPANGIMHVVGPEQGIVLCGQTVVCGDSHTSTHGALGNIAFGIGTSEVEMVLASQCILQTKPKQARLEIDGKLGEGVCPKDVILYIISKLGTNGCTGHFVEYCGDVFRNMSMEGRMTVCNMSIEMGARGGLVAPDETTFEYIKGRDYAPRGAELERCIETWRGLRSDPDACYDAEFKFDAADIKPMVTYGTNPGMGMAADGTIPSSAVGCQPSDFKAALAYTGVKPGGKMLGRKVDYVFVGSCTNGRMEDFRLFASIVKGHRKSDDVTVWIVPGSKRVERAMEDEGISGTLREAGFEIRQPGCSACLAMNDDKIPAGKKCLSTSNRNFVGRQGTGSVTFLAGPAIAAATAINGYISLPKEIANVWNHEKDNNH